MGAQPREAATVVLLREGAAGLETWLLRRVPRMAFAAGMSVFPGGAVDEADRCAVVGLDRIAAQLDTTLDHAGALVCAAMRETFEEVGVLLSSPPIVVAPEVRIAVENRQRSFVELLSERGAELDASLIQPWARWITPAGEPRRFDTYFFVAALPAGAAAEAVSGEASHADWILVAEALAEYDRGERPMLPPTVVTLTEISRFPTAAAVLDAAGRRKVETITPVIRQDADGVWVADFGCGTVLPLPHGFLSASGRKPS